MLLNVLQISRSTYFYNIKSIASSDKNAELKAKITEIFNKNKGRYGYRRITLELRNQGFIVNHKKVNRLTKVL